MLIMIRRSRTRSASSLTRRSHHVQASLFTRQQHQQRRNNAWPWNDPRVLSFTTTTTTSSSSSTTTTTKNTTEESASKSSSSSSSSSCMKTIKPEFYVPRRLRQNSRPMFDIDYMIGETRLSRSKRTCPTRELYFLPKQWGRHKSPYRKIRHMMNLFRAAPLQRLLFPDLFGITMIACGLTYYNEILVNTTDAASALTMNPAAFAGATTAIGLLAGFRLNNSYGRYREGRQVWSDVQTNVRELSRQVHMWMWIPSSNGSDIGIYEQARLRLLHLAKAFPISLTFHLNEKGSHHNMKRLSKLGDEQFYQRVYVEFQAEIFDIYYNHDDIGGMHNDENTDSDDAPYGTHKEWITNETLRNDYLRLCQVKKNGGSVPLEVIICMSETIGILSCQQQLQQQQSQSSYIHPVYIQQLDEKISNLTKALGSGERILKTPLPTGFARHSSRLLFIWSHCLPFALYPIMGPYGTLPTSLLTSYAVLGIEDISVQLEEPFDILPMRQFTNTMYDSIVAIEKGYKNGIYTTSIITENDDDSTVSNNEN